MKKILIGFIIIIVSFIGYYKTKYLSVDQDLYNKMLENYQLNKKPVKLRPLTNFEWDNYIIMGCYQNFEMTEKEYNINLDNIKNNGIESSDWYTLLVFLKNKKSINVCELKTNVEIKIDPEGKLEK